MELWIRSQNKRELIMVEHITIFDNEICSEKGSIDTLGKYKTKERALEVLDEIQNLLSMPPVHIDNGIEYYMPNDGSSKIYEMPKE